MNKKKVIFISGSGSGLGLALVKRFSKDGHLVYAGTRNAKKLKLALGGEKSNDNIIIVPMNVSNDISVFKTFSKIENQGIEIDVLINNAACSLLGSVEETPLIEIKKIFEVNFFGALRCIKAVLPGMRKRKSGTIVNISSVNALSCKPFVSAYATSKHALDFFSEGLYEEVRGFGIKILTVDPGLMKSQFVANSFSVNPSKSVYFTKVLDYKSKVTAAIDSSGIDPERIADQIVTVVFSDILKLIIKDGRIIG